MTEPLSVMHSKLLDALCPWVWNRVTEPLSVMHSKLLDALCPWVWNPVTEPVSFVHLILVHFCLQLHSYNLQRRKMVGIIIIMYIYHALINTMSAHMKHNNLNTVMDSETGPTMGGVSPTNLTDGPSCLSEQPGVFEGVAALC